MFKKLVTIIAAALLVLSTVGSAFAALADLELIRVVYERTSGTAEQLTDLGNVTTLLVGNHTIAGDALTASKPSNLFVGYLAVDRTNGDIWVSNSTSIAPVAVGSKGFTVLNSGITSVYTYYKTLSADANGVLTGQQSNNSSYKNKIDANQGSLGNAINIATRTSTEASLADLVGATIGSVTQILYHLNGNNTGEVGVPVATVTTNFDGSTTISPPLLQLPSRAPRSSELPRPQMIAKQPSPLQPRTPTAAARSPATPSPPIRPTELTYSPDRTR